MDWAECYRSGDIPWEKGEPHPELPFLLRKYKDLFLNAERLLVPGCGYGHDAALISEVAGGRVEGLDLAKEALSGAASRYPGDGVDWQHGDLFQWSQGREAKYDLVWEHTCFSAIPPERRIDYASAMSELVRSGGCLLGVFFPKPDHPEDEGPPFHVSISELSSLFQPSFALEWSEQPSKTFESRKGEGRELSMLWRRR